MNYPCRKAPLICLPQYKDSDLNVSKNWFTKEEKEPNFDVGEIDIEN